MTQAALFITWLNSHQPISLAEFRTLSSIIPGVFEAVVTEVTYHGADRDRGYTLVHCRLNSFSSFSDNSPQSSTTKFCLECPGSSGGDDISVDSPRRETISYLVVTVRRDFTRSTSTPAPFRRLWSESPSPLQNYLRRLTLGHIIEMCEYLTQDNPAFASNICFPISGALWLRLSLSEYLRGCRLCFGKRESESSKTELIPPQVAQALVYAKNRYLREKHHCCSYLVSAPELPIPPLGCSEQGLATSEVKHTCPTGVGVSVPSGLQALPSDSTTLPTNLFGTANASSHRGGTHTLKASKVRPLLLSFRCTVPVLEDGDKTKRVFESTATKASSWRRQPAQRYLKEPAAQKRRMDVSGEGERSTLEENKRAKVSHTENEGPEHTVMPEEIMVAPSTSLAISRTMPLSDIVSLLVQHGCRDITHILDLPACSEYPISSGGFGDIFRGKLSDSSLVVIKCMRIMGDLSDYKEHDLKSAAREIHTWSKLDHRYVSKLLGLAQFRGQIAMISPWAEHGALPVFLARRPQQNRPRLCAQIADGLAFLHEHQIVQGDLKGDALHPILLLFTYEQHENRRIS